MSCHVLIDDLPTSQAADIRKQIAEVAEQQFNIEHTTVQMECQQCAANDMFCTLTIKHGGENKDLSPHHH